MKIHIFKFCVKWVIKKQLFSRHGYAALMPTYSVDDTIIVIGAKIVDYGTLDKFKFCKNVDKYRFTSFKYVLSGLLTLN